MQAKRIDVSEATGSGAFNHRAQIQNPLELRTEANFHNIWASLCVEPTTQDANARGTWVLYNEPIGGVEPVFSDAIVQGELNNARMIACGIWCASNQAPFNLVINPRISRNMTAGETLKMVAHVVNITAGNVVLRLMVCAHVTRK